MGFPWLAAGMTAVNVAGSLISGSQRSRTSDYNAQVAMNYAIANSDAIRQAGAMNAGNIMAAGRINAAMATQASEIQAGLTRYMGTVNAYIARHTARFNSLLLENDIKNYLTEKGYALSELEKEFTLYKGEAVATQAASGTIIGEGSNKQVIINSQADFEMNKFVLNQNYDQKIRTVSNQIMLNTYQGELAARKYQIEAEASAIGALTSGALQAAGAMAQAGIDASTTQMNAGIAAWQTMHDGSWQASQYEQQADQQWTDGIIGAISGGINTFNAFGGFNTSGKMLG